MDLHWRTNLGVSVFHAADQLRRGAALRPELEAALREPTAKLVQSIAEERLSPALFWRHLVPQAAEFDSMRRLAEVVLVKLQGRTEARIRIPRFQRNLTAIRDAFVEAYSQPPDQTGALKQRWVQECPGLFAGIKNWTDENVLVPEATIFLVPPVTVGGGGTAHPPYNSVRIEALGVDSVANFPESLRLGWLLSQLNLDVPAFSEDVPPQRLDLVAALAMIPVALTAAENLKLASATDDAIAQAAQTWLPPSDRGDGRIDLLTQWWSAYKGRRPHWSAALAALDRLLAD